MQQFDDDMGDDWDKLGGEVDGSGNFESLLAGGMMILFHFSLLMA